MWWALPVIVGVLLGEALTPPAAAFYGNGAQIVSADFGRLEQGDDATQFAAMAAGGRYVAIQTLARNFFPDGDADPPGQFRQGGLFRFDLATRRIELIADGDFKDEADPSAIVLRGARNPSISADGRYVAFATGQRLTPADVNANVDVYVRDMEVPIRASSAFELISTKDGGDAPATYAAPGAGSEVTRGTAISADGSRIAFRTEAESDLPASGAPGVAAGQLLVRDRAAHTTTLVTRTLEAGAPAGGAAGPASISADGTTVLWTGANAPDQTRFIKGENTDSGFNYYLWRRIADGPTAPTRRVTGISDPDDPDCPSNAAPFFSETATGPCYGPLTQREFVFNASFAAALSGDGYTVAFVTDAGPRPNPNPGNTYDLYVTRMNPGLTRKQATVELTREGASGDPEATQPIDAVSMSADGRWLGVTTARTRFLLPTLRPLGDRRLVPNKREIYAIDLQDLTVERVTRAISGGDVEDGVSSEATLSADGGRIAFTAFARDLFFGDANERADAFVATRQPEPVLPPGGGGGGLRIGAEDVTEDLGGDEVALPTTVRRAGAGVLELRIRVPAPGTITVTGRGRVATSRKHMATRVLARATKFSPRAGQVVVRLEVVRRYRPQLKRRKALPARLGIVFSPSRGGRRVSRSMRVVFRDAPKKERRATPRKERR